MEVKSSDNTGSSNICVKFDGLPKLKGQSNYQTWSDAWKIAFNAADWWKALNIEFSTEDDTSLPKVEIKKARKQIHNLLIGAVPENIQPIVVSAENAHQAWKVLKDLYDHVSPNTMITLLSCFLDTNMEDNSNLTENLKAPNTNWNTPHTRCQSADHKLAHALQPFHGLTDWYIGS